MSELIAPVVKGEVKQTATAAEKKSTKGSTELGKDAFLQLLVCQMQHQNPLEPSTDTEYIAQLATFSQLEQLQNLNASFDNTQAFSLIGKNVVLKTSDNNEKVNYVSGQVDFINMSGKSMKLSVNGKLYDLDQLYSVIDDVYLLNQKLPSIPEEYSFTFDAETPTAFQFEVNFGEDDAKASEIAIILNEELLDSSTYSVNGNKVTIKPSAFEGLSNGTYRPTVVFNNSYYTSITDMIKIQVVNSEVVEDSTKPEPEVKDESAG